MARRMSPRRRQFEALLDQYEDEIRRAFTLAIEDVRGNVQLMQFQNAIERIRTAVGANFTGARYSVGWQLESARVRAALALETASINASLAALNLEYEFFRPIGEAFRRTFLAGGDSGVADLPKLSAGDGARVVIRFDVRNPAAEQWLNDHSSRFITRIVSEQRDMVRSALVDGMARGQNPSQTALSIAGRVDRVTGRISGGVLGLSGPQERTMSWVREAFEQNDTEAMKRYLGLKMRDKRYDATIRQAIKSGKLTTADADKIAGRLSDRYLKLRADTIARTESLTSLNAGRTEAFRQAVEKAGIDPVNVTRVWSATLDGRTRDTHAAMNGQTVTGPNSPFRTPGGAMMMFPGDSSLGAPASETISCRCTTLLRVDYFEGRG